MNERGEHGDDQSDSAHLIDIHILVETFEWYCHGDYSWQDFEFAEPLSVEGLQVLSDGIPPDALLDSPFFHDACSNEGVTLEIIRWLHDKFGQGAARSTNDFEDWSPLHYACKNKRMDPEIVRLLLVWWPESVNHREDRGRLPLHMLCETISIDETSSLAILDLLVAAAPLSATIADPFGCLPIHRASESGRSYPFCKRLIDAWPESLRVQNGRGDLPIHFACAECNVEIVKYMIEHYPESINTWGDGELPIHCAALSRDNSTRKADIIRYLLAKDPECASKTGSTANRLPFHWVASEADSLESLRLLFDAYPEAIDIRDGMGNNPLDLARGALVDFLEEQLAYARKAEDHRVMTTTDEKGWLPLHHALQSGACLGAIKLLIKGNPSALRVVGNNWVLPLHIACEFSSVGVLQHITGLSAASLHTRDLEGNSPLHYACQGGNLGVVKYLLEQHVPSVLEPNSSGKLPVHLLWDSNRVDRDSVEYVDAVWRLLLAHPETVMH